MYGIENYLFICLLVLQTEWFIEVEQGVTLLVTNRGHSYSTDTGSSLNASGLFDGVIYGMCGLY